MSADELERGYRRAYRDLYRWESIVRGASVHGNVVAGLRHLAYSAGWKKFEPLWDFVIRAKRVGMMLPLLETILTEFGQRALGAAKRVDRVATIVETVETTLERSSTFDTVSSPVSAGLSGPRSYVWPADPTAPSGRPIRHPAPPLRHSLVEASDDGAVAVVSVILLGRRTEPVGRALLAKTHDGHRQPQSFATRPNRTDSRRDLTFRLLVRCRSCRLQRLLARNREVRERRGNITVGIDGEVELEP
jgi:hypothetical protein